MKRILLLMFGFMMFTTLWSQSMTETDIAKQLMQRGATADQVQRIRQQYARQMGQNGHDGSTDNTVGETNRMRVNNEKSYKEKRFDTGSDDTEGEMRFWSRHL